MASAQPASRSEFRWNTREKHYKIQNLLGVAVVGVMIRIVGGYALIMLMGPGLLRGHPQEGHNNPSNNRSSRPLVDEP